MDHSLYRQQHKAKLSRPRRLTERELYVAQLSQMLLNRMLFLMSVGDLTTADPARSEPSNSPG